MWSILIILIVSLAAAGLVVWMRGETASGSSCGFSCGCCTRCDELMRKLSADKMPAEKKET